MRVFVWLVAAAMLDGCAPNPPAPVSIMAILYDQSNTLGPQQTQLQTVSNVTALTGTIGTLVGGASIILDPTNPAQMNLLGLSDDQLANALYAERGGAVTADLIDKSGVLWPADFHSWDMVTAYWNFEQAYLYFQQMYDGADTTDLEGATILYWVDYEDLSVGDPAQQKLTDNALYYSPLHAFLLAPYDSDLQAVPSPMNTGIIGHEYAHRVFNEKAAGGAGVPGFLTWSGEPLNIVKSMDEGLADFHGYGVTCTSADTGGPGCSTNFLEPSFGTAQVVTDRDFSLDDKCMTATLQNALMTQDNGTFLGQGLQYKVGTLFAASLWQAGNKAGGTSGTQEIREGAHSRVRRREQPDPGLQAAVRGEHRHAREHHPRADGRHDPLAHHRPEPAAADLQRDVGALEPRPHEQPQPERPAPLPEHLDARQHELPDAVKHMRTLFIVMLAASTAAYGQRKKSQKEDAPVPYSDQEDEDERNKRDLPNHSEATHERPDEQQVSRTIGSSARLARRPEHRPVGRGHSGRDAAAGLARRAQPQFSGGLRFTWEWSRTLLTDEFWREVFWVDVAWFATSDDAAADSAQYIGTDGPPRRARQHALSLFHGRAGHRLARRQDAARHLRLGGLRHRVPDVDGERGAGAEHHLGGALSGAVRRRRALSHRRDARQQGARVVQARADALPPRLHGRHARRWEHRRDVLTRAEYGQRRLTPRCAGP